MLIYTSGDTILYNSDLPTITVGENNVASPQVVGLSTTNTSSDNVLLAGGNTPGPDQVAANFGVGNDKVQIATNPTMDMNGKYLGGTGFDSLELYNTGEEGVKIDFSAGVGGENSAFVNVVGSDIGFSLMNLKV